MIRYPKALQPGDTIAVTAPSSGVEKELHWVMEQAKEKVEKMGYNVIIGDTVWTEDKARSASKETRAKELMEFFLHEDVDVIMPPWGGQFLMEILPLLDWNVLKDSKPKWIMGYSDISTLSFAYTLHTNTASAHGTNFFDLSMNQIDAVTGKWASVLGTLENESITQTSSDLYQSSWEKAIEKTGEGFALDTKTEWKTHTGEEVNMEGRLIGGCLNTIDILAGTKHAPFEQFQADIEEGLIWYLEWVDSSAGEVLRSIWRLKELGWFENTNGVLVGRPCRPTNTKNFTSEEAILNIFNELNIPVIYDADVGHMPPQLTLLNGAYAEVHSSNGKGIITITKK